MQTPQFLMCHLLRLEPLTGWALDDGHFRWHIKDNCLDQQKEEMKMSEERVIIDKNAEDPCVANLGLITCRMSLGELAMSLAADAAYNKGIPQQEVEAWCNARIVTYLKAAADIFNAIQATDVDIAQEDVLRHMDTSSVAAH